MPVALGPQIRRRPTRPFLTFFSVGARVYERAALSLFFPSISPLPKRKEQCPLVHSFFSFACGGPHGRPLFLLLFLLWCARAGGRTSHVTTNPKGRPMKWGNKKGRPPYRAPMPLRKNIDILGATIAYAWQSVNTKKKERNPYRKKIMTDRQPERCRPCGRPIFFLNRSRSTLYLFQSSLFFLCDAVCFCPADGRRESDPFLPERRDTQKR